MALKLWYLLSGPVGVATPKNTTTNILHAATQRIPDPDLQRFWIVESLGIMPKDHSTKPFLELYMTNNIECLPNGYYSACFPWKESHPALLETSWHVTIGLDHCFASWPKLLLSIPGTAKFWQIRCAMDSLNECILLITVQGTTTFHILLSGKTLKSLTFVLFMTAAAINQGTSQVWMTAYSVVIHSWMIFAA